MAAKNKEQLQIEFPPADEPKIERTEIGTEVDPFDKMSSQFGNYSARFSTGISTLDPEAVEEPVATEPQPAPPKKAYKIKKDDGRLKKNKVRYDPSDYDLGL